MATVKIAVTRKYANRIRPTRPTPATFTYVLGSSSKRRRALFKKYLNSEHFVDGADIDEEAIHHPQPEVRTQFIAKAKAEAIVTKGNIEDDQILVCLDQVIRFMGEIWEKPDVPYKARELFKAHCDNPDEPLEWSNGICLYYKGRYLTTVDTSKVFFEKINVEDLVVKGGDCVCRAGGFVAAGLTVRELRGSHESVEGLPVIAIKNLARYILLEKKITHCMFDLDGLLLNTGDTCAIAYDMVLKKYGRKMWNWAIKSQLKGMPATETAKKTVELAWQRKQIESPEGPLTPEQFLTEPAELLKPMLAKSQFLPGAIELLYELKTAGIPVALATACPRKLLQMKISNFRKYFDDIFGSNVVCGDEVEGTYIVHGRGKPDPEIFLKALNMISGGKQVDPECVMVFEDGPIGVAAGLAAGNIVTMIPDENFRQDAMGKAHVQLRSLEFFNLQQFIY